MANIPFTVPGFYTNQTGIYTDPQTSELVPSNNNCCMRLDLPCPWVKELKEINIDSTDGVCIFSWCKLQKDISSIAASNLLVANDAAAVNPALTNAEVTALTALAKLISCANC